MAARLSSSSEGALLSWLEPRAEGHVLRFGEWRRGRGWSEARDVVAGGDFSANWADLPAVVEAPDGALVAHWLAKLGEGTYAYGVRLARSTDRGVTWVEQAVLHDDASETEHGFVSWIPEGSDLRAFWLDGRRTAEEGGAMELRTALVDATGPGPSEVVDARVCDCCATSAVVVPDGALVAFRDRSETEVRDIRIARSAEGWRPTERLRPDGWTIHGCPVNGPAVDALGERVAVAWFTGADDEPRVLLAFSDDGGASFAEPLTVDDEGPIGRVGLVLDHHGRAWVSWLGAAGEGEGVVRLAGFGPEGPVGDPAIVAWTSTARQAGVPQLARVDDHLLLVAWIEPGRPVGGGPPSPDQLRARTVPTDPWGGSPSG